LDWLNGWRLHLVVDEFLNCINYGDSSLDVKVADIAISSPTEASTKEPLVFLPERRTMSRQSAQYPIRMGVSFNQLAELTKQQPSQSRLAKRKDNYILAVGERCILVAFFSNSSNSEKAKAYFHGCLARHALVALQNDCKEGPLHDNELEIVQKAEEAAESQLDRLWPIFEQCITDSGWVLGKTECSTEGYQMYLE